MVINEAELCQNVRYCDYASSANYEAFEMIDLSGMLQRYGLPPLRSLDKTVRRMHLQKGRDY